MFPVDSPESNEAALLALLNLVVKDEKNEVSIVEAVALEPIITFLKSKNVNLQEYATASLLTLSTSMTNKPIITASGAIPLLANILNGGYVKVKRVACEQCSGSTYGWFSSPRPRFSEMADKKKGASMLVPGDMLCAEKKESSCCRLSLKYSTVHAWRRR